MSKHDSNSYTLKDLDYYRSTPENFNQINYAQIQIWKKRGASFDLESQIAVIYQLTVNPDDQLLKDLLDNKLIRPEEIKDPKSKLLLQKGLEDPGRELPTRDLLLTVLLSEEINGIELSKLQKDLFHDLFDDLLNIKSSTNIPGFFFRLLKAFVPEVQNSQHGGNALKYEHPIVKALVQKRISVEAASKNPFFSQDFSAFAYKGPAGMAYAASTLDTIPQSKVQQLLPALQLLSALNSQDCQPAKRTTKRKRDDLLSVEVEENALNHPAKKAKLI